jgi:hypothetical protein
MKEILFQYQELQKVKVSRGLSKNTISQEDLKLMVLTITVNQDQSELVQNQEEYIKEKNFQDKWEMQLKH